MSENYYDDAFGVDTPADRLEESFYENPAAASLAIAQLAAKQEVDKARAEILAEAEKVAAAKNSDLTALEFERAMDATLPDWRSHSDEIAARLQQIGVGVDGVDLATAVRRAELAYRAVKDDAQRTTDAQEWRAVMRAAATEPGAYWDERRKLVDIPASQGGLADG